MGSYASMPIASVPIARGRPWTPPTNIHDLLEGLVCVSPKALKAARVEFFRCLYDDQFDRRLHSDPFDFGGVALDLTGVVELPPAFFADAWVRRNLSALYCRDGALSGLPAELDGCEELQYVNCNNNQFTAVPPVLGRLRHLHQVAFGRNLLSEISAESFAGSHAVLESLDVSGNLLMAFPAFLFAPGAAPRLDRLDCGDNRIANLELCEFAETRNAHVCIVLTGNPLADIPPEFGEISGLIDVRVDPAAVAELRAAHESLREAIGDGPIDPRRFASWLKANASRLSARRTEAARRTKRAAA